jgi:hypothetical protein
MDIRIPLLAGAALVAPLHASAAPAANQASNDVGAVYRLAKAMEAKLQCAPAPPGAAVPPENVATAVEFGHLASMYAFAAAHYPSDIKQGRDSQINALVDDASRAYGRAFDCNPTTDSVLYLDHGIELLEDRAAQMDASDPLTQEFARRAASFRDKRPETTCTRPPHPSCLKPVATDAPAETTGYRARYAERVALGFGLGGGQFSLHGDEDNTLSHFTLRFTLGPRFVLGERKRHILGPGLSYALHTILTIDGATPKDSAALHQAGPVLEYGFAPRPNFSLHALVGFDVGAGIYTVPATGERFSFNAITVGGGGGLCTLHTALCARVRGQTSITVDSTSLTGFDVTVGLDFFRLADLALARKRV